MSTRPSLQLRASQSLVMTEQLQQSIKLLQLSALELTEFIEQEMEKNPLLTTEEAGDEAAGQDDSAPEAAQDTAALASQAEDGLYTRSPEAGGGEVAGGGEEASLDVSNDDIWGGEHESRRYDEGGGGGGDAGDGSVSYLSDMIEQSYSEAPSLKEHILEQVQHGMAEPQKKLIAAHLVDLLDEAGYLREDISHLPELLGCDMAEIEEIWEWLKNCDPVGVCARDVRECLYLQLKDRGQLSAPMERLLDHLDMIGEPGGKKLARLCGVSEKEMAAMLATLKKLDPRPGSHFTSEQSETLIPDILVRKIGREGWRVEVNADVLPRLLVNRQYYAELAGRARRKEDRKFLNEHLANANWLVKALDQRAQTLLKVGSEIVRQQEMFLEHGIRHLRPMTLRHIADAVEVHESTVSRVTSGKHMATPRGVFQMKYFFSSSLADAAGGEGTSSRAVMHLIKEIIDAESASDILSDDAIAGALEQRGIDVARRTVVKYRKIMRIDSSVERRRQKRGK